MEISFSSHRFQFVSLFLLDLAKFTFSSCESFENLHNPGQTDEFRDENAYFIPGTPWRGVHSETVVDFNFEPTHRDYSFVASAGPP